MIDTSTRAMAIIRLGMPRHNGAAMRGGFNGHTTEHEEHVKLSGSAAPAQYKSIGFMPSSAAELAVCCSRQQPRDITRHFDRLDIVLLHA